MAWGDMAVIYVTGFQGRGIAQQLDRKAIPHLWMASKHYKSSYDPSVNRVTVLSLQSSKGLEFSGVILVGVGSLSAEDVSRDARLLYVGMTRAQQNLQICSSTSSLLCEKIASIAV